MVNSLITTSVIANEALAVLYEGSVFARLMHRDYESDFQAGVGATISIRKPATFVAKDFVRANGIELQDASESLATITLDQHKDVSFAVTDHELTLTVADFSKQLLTPALQAIIEGIEATAVGTIAGVATSTGSTTAPMTVNEFVDARTALGKRKVPKANRFALLNPVAAGQLLKDPSLRNADVSNDGGAALRESAIGRIQMADTYEMTGLADTQNVMAHANAFAFVSRPLSPAAGTDCVVRDFEGFSVRVVQQYDIIHKQTVVSVDTLFGCKAIDPRLAQVMLNSATV